MVRYNAVHVPYKYGYTKKMEEIWELVYTHRTLEDADFEPTAEDVEYYNDCFSMYNIRRQQLGHDFRFEHFVNDIDP